MKFYTDELRLSPYTFSVATALHEKRLKFETVEVGFEMNRSLTPAFRGRTFTDLIPALEDRDLVLSESLAILEYLEERYPAPQYPAILPLSIDDRARARMLLSWYRCGMTALRNERSTETFLHPELRGRALPPLSEAAKDEVGELTAALSALLAPAPNEYLFGGWTIVDSETSLMLHRLIANGDPVDPRLQAYAEHVWTRPSGRIFLDAIRKPFRSDYR
jgi:glutathione S-transferase